MCKCCLLSDRETALGFIIFFTFFSRGKAFLYMRINASIWETVHSPPFPPHSPPPPFPPSHSHPAQLSKRKGLLINKVFLLAVKETCISFESIPA